MCLRAGVLLSLLSSWTAVASLDPPSVTLIDFGSISVSGICWAAATGGGCCYSWLSSTFYYSSGGFSSLTSSFAGSLAGSFTNSFVSSFVNWGFLGGLPLLFCGVGLAPSWMLTSAYVSDDPVPFVLYRTSGMGSTLLIAAVVAASVFAT